MTRRGIILCGAFKIESRNKPLAVADPALEEQPELVVSVPVVNGINDWPQLARQPVDIDGAHVRNNFRPLPVEILRGREARERFAIVAPEPGGVSAQHILADLLDDQKVYALPSLRSPSHR